VPLEQTSAPVDLDLVLAGARLPYRQRLQIVLNEFGALGAARGDDINEVIRRANPALRDAREVFEILNEQRSELKAALSDTDTILASIAKDPDALGGFVEQARNVTRRTADHADDIDQIVSQLPSLLAEARPGLDQLDRLTVAATPVARGLKEAAPDLTDLAEELQPFADEARPALRTLDEVASTGRQAVKDSVGSIDALKPAAKGLDETLHETFPLTNNLTKRGGPEGTMSFIFNVMSSVARFDRWSHILPVRGATTPCTTYNTGPTLKECENRYDTDGEAGIASRGGRARKPAGPSGFADQVLTEAGRAAGAEQGAAKEDDEQDDPGEADRRPRLPEALDKPVRETTDKVREGVEKVKDSTGKLLDFLLGP
jgi:ABC-type transporter Mla subunit MlaD